MVSANLIPYLGATMVAVRHVSGGIPNPQGLDMPDVLSFLSTRGNLLESYNAPGVTHITNEALLVTDTDILIPAALENQITVNNANDIKAKFIVEGANGPTTIEADEILEKNGVTVVPDILANAGGVIVSYFEWVQNIQSLVWDEDEVNKTLNRILCNAFENVYELHKEKNIPLRTSAYAVALKTLVRAKKARGIFP